MADKIMPLSEAVEGYDMFDKMKVQKGTVISPNKMLSIHTDSNAVVFEAQK
jgi:hypothetical protein